MIIKTKSVRELARQAGLEPELVDRNIDPLCEFVFRIAKRERKFCQDKLRQWAHTEAAPRVPMGQYKYTISNLLNDEDDHDLM